MYALGSTLFRPHGSPSGHAARVGDLVLVIRVAVALIWYFTYSVWHSSLGRHEHVGLISDVEED